MSDENERSVASAGSTFHTPDASRLPKCVAGWVPITPEMQFTDGEQWLMAVPVCCRHSQKWYYEYSVVTMCCDGDYFAIEYDGNPWGWELASVDFGVRLSR